MKKHQLKPQKLIFQIRNSILQFGFILILCSILANCKTLIKTPKNKNVTVNKEGNVNIDSVAIAKIGKFTFDGFIPYDG